MEIETVWNLVKIWFDVTIYFQICTSLHPYRGHQSFHVGLTTLVFVTDCEPGAFLIHTHVTLNQGYCCVPSNLSWIEMCHFPHVWDRLYYGCKDGWCDVRLTTSIQPCPFPIHSTVLNPILPCPFSPHCIPYNHPCKTSIHLIFSLFFQSVRLWHVGIPEGCKVSED